MSCLADLARAELSGVDREKLYSKRNYNGCTEILWKAHYQNKLLLVAPLNINYSREKDKTLFSEFFLHILSMLLHLKFPANSQDL